MALEALNPLRPFLWGAGGAAMTPEEIAREREIAAALMQVDTSPVGHWLEGAARMANAFSGRVRDNRARQAETANIEYNAGKRQEIINLLTGGAPAASTASSASAGSGSTGSGSFVPQDYFEATRRSESGGNNNAKNPRSSALGPYQFIDSTWQGLAKKYPELGLTPDGRTDPEQSERAMRAFTADNAKVLSSAGIPITGGSLYAAHFLGADGARNVLSADPGASVAGIVGQGVVNANPFLKGMSVAQFRDWASKKGGGNAPVDLGGGTQVASLDPSVGLPAADPYSNIPAVDGMGQDQRAKFRAWNSDPAGNEAANMAGIDPALQGVIQRAREISGQNFVLGSGRRSPEQQRVAMANGWSGTMDSDHLGGGAADIWPLDENGAVNFDPQRQQQIVAAMKQAAGELGVDMEAGADWRRKDMPHFGMVGQTPLDNAPIPQARPDQTAGLFVGTPDELAASRQPQIPPQMLAAQGMGGPQQGFVMPQQAQAPGPAPIAPQQVAQAAPQRPAINPEILSIFADPRADRGTREIASLLLEREMGQQQAAQQAQAERDAWTFQRQWLADQEANDPAHQLDMDYKRAQIAKMQADMAAGPSDGESFYGNPVAIQNQDGTISYGQMGNKGTFRPIQLPEGQAFAPPTRSIDAGTETIMMDQAGNVIARTPKNLREAASETGAGRVVGEAQGQALVDLGSTLQQADQSIGLIDAMLTHPGLKTATGASSVFDPRNYIAGTDATDFNERSKQLQGRAFLQAFESLKGGGQITEIEGQKATQAIARLSTAQSEEAYREALNELRSILELGKTRALERAGLKQAPPAAAPAKASPVTINGYTIEQVD